MSSEDEWRGAVTWREALFGRQTFPILILTLLALSLIGAMRTLWPEGAPPPPPAPLALTLRVKTVTRLDDERWQVEAEADPGPLTLGGLTWTVDRCAPAAPAVTVSLPSQSVANRGASPGPIPLVAFELRGAPAGHTVTLEGRFDARIGGASNIRHRGPASLTVSLPAAPSVDADAPR